jgi:hypothetical protein
MRRFSQANLKTALNGYPTHYYFPYVLNLGIPVVPKTAVRYWNPCFQAPYKHATRLISTFLADNYRRADAAE